MRNESVDTVRTKPFDHPRRSFFGQPLSLPRNADYPGNIGFLSLNRRLDESDCPRLLAQSHDPIQPSLVWRRTAADLVLVPSGQFTKRRWSASSELVKIGMAEHSFHFVGMTDRQWFQSESLGAQFLCQLDHRRNLTSTTSQRGVDRRGKVRWVVKTNNFGQPVGDGLSGWIPPPTLEPAALVGSSVTLEPMLPGDGARLFQALSDEPESLWTYMSIGPFESANGFEASLTEMMDRKDWSPYVILVGDEIEGFLTYLRIDLPGGVIEIGSIVFSSALQRTTAATEAIYLLIRHAFESGFRRVEWKCDDLNSPSMRSAHRFGFTYEGTFKQATHYKGRNRDTAWFAIVESDWPTLRQGYDEWLAPDNFDDSGKQIRSLEACRLGVSDHSG